MGSPTKECQAFTSLVDRLLTVPKSKIHEKNGRASRALSQESQQAWTEKRTQESPLVPALLAIGRQFLIGEKARGNSFHREIEPCRVTHHLPVVEPEHLLVQIPLKVERFDAHVSAMQAALGQGPEVLQPVRVNVPVQGFTPVP
jgi:hypothetical protein